MNIKELKIYVEILESIDPDAVVYWEDGRDGQSALTEVQCRVNKQEVPGQGTEYQLVFMYE